MRCLLNDKKISSIKPTNKRQEFWDISLPGFGMRVSKNGQKTFFVMCRDNGKQRRLSLGRYPIITLAEAHKVAIEKLRLVAQGLPLELEQQEVMSVEQAFKNFIEMYSKRKNKDWKRAEARLNGTLIKTYGHLDIREVTRENIHYLLDKIMSRDAPIQANRVHAGVSKFFKWCAERGYIEASPVLYISKPAKENPRDRVLSDDELAVIWDEADRIGYPFGPLFKILILTGQRKGEVSSMCWNEISIKDRVWIIPKEKAKNGHSHAVPLSNQVLKILESMPRFLHYDLVFTTTGKTPVSGFGHLKTRLDQSSGVNGWIIHDIRRTVASGMARLKVTPYVVEKILNHISGTFSSVTGVYNRYGYDDEKREAIEIWADYVLGIVNGKANNVRRIL